MSDPWDHQSKLEVIEEDPGTGEIFNGIPDWVYEGKNSVFVFYTQMGVSD